MNAVILVATAVAALLAGMALSHAWRSLEMIEHTLRNQAERIAALEAAQAKHMPYVTADEIENATAAILRLKQELDLKVDFVDNALAHLGKARNPKGK